MTKKVKKSKDCCPGKMSDNIAKGIEELKKMARQAKSKFDKADGKTKKQVLAGVIGAASLLAGAVGIKAIKKKMKK